MGKYLKALLSGIPGAIFVAILWFWVNSATGGMLERAPFPLNDIYACVGIGITLGIAGSCLAIFFANRRREALEGAAAGFGMEFSEKVDRNSLNVEGRLHIFDDWLEASNHMEGVVDDVPIQIFDLWKQHTSRSHGKSGSNRRTHNQKQTVYLMPLPQKSPVSVQLIQKGALGWMLGAMGFDGIEFELDGQFATDEDRRILAKFNEQYLVVQGLRRGGSNPKPTQPVPDDSEKVLALLEQRLSLDLLRKLAEGRGFSLEICESHLAVWQHKTCVAPGDLVGALAEIVELYTLLVDGPADQRRMKLSASGQTSLTPEVSVRSFGAIAAGGCVGMFLAFAMFVPVFFLFVEQAPWIVFVWPFFGMAVVAGSVFVSTRIAGKWRKRSDPFGSDAGR